MELLLSYCGLDCAECAIRRATLELNSAKQRAARVQIAQQCVEQYGMTLTIDDITDCDGCAVSGRLFSGCSRCAIRPCARERQLASCAECEDYACSNLLQHFKSDSSARTRLEAMRH